MSHRFTRPMLSPQDLDALNALQRWVDEHRTGLVIPSNTFNPAEKFQASITAVDVSGNYSWTRQAFDATAAYITDPVPLAGTPTEMPAKERNGRTATSFPFYAELTRRIHVSGSPVYEFDLIEASSGSTELKGLTFTSDTDSTADSDPGAGLFKWNHATQSSATFLYFDDLTSDSADVTTYFASLKIAGGGYLRLQQHDDSTRWQEWKWKSITDASGYTKLAVSFLAWSGSAIQDNKTVLCDFKPPGGFSGARVTKDFFDIPDSTPTAIEWTSTPIDTDSYFAGGNPTRLTCPRDGIYDVSYSAQWDSPGGSTAIYVNGTDILTSLEFGSGFIKNYPASAGDYFEVIANQTSGGTIQVSAGGGDALWFAIERIGDYT